MYLEAATLKKQHCYFGRLALWPGLQNNSLNFWVRFCPRDWDKFQRTSEFDRPSGMGLLGTENLV